MNAVRLSARNLRPVTWPESGPQITALDLQAGETCAIIGPDGGGKTTWLRTLAAVDRPAGQLTLAGTDCTDLAPAAWRSLQRRVGYIGAGAPLLSVVDGKSNVLMAAQYHRLDTHDALEAKAEMLLERLHWSGPLNVLPAFLDPHQKHILALARTLMLDPELLFIDEPFQMAGASGWHALGLTLAQLAAEQNLTVALATNHLPYVRRHANHILFTDAQGVRHFEGWEAMSQATDAGVQRFLASGDRAFEGT